MPCTLHTLVSIIMDCGHNFLEQGRRGRDVEAPVEEHHVVLDRPGRGSGPCSDFVVNGGQGWVDGLCVTEAADEVEARS